LKLNKNKIIDQEFIEPDKYGEKRDLLNELADGILLKSMRGIYNF